jgi:hypothetical protein
VVGEWLRVSNVETRYENLRTPKKKENVNAQEMKCFGR